MELNFQQNRLECTLYYTGDIQADGVLRLLYRKRARMMKIFSTINKQHVHVYQYTHSTSHGPI